MASKGSARHWRLVLSAGGTMGAYWMVGALQALYERGLDPRTAEIIVGTSAGSVLGAILACGRLPWEIGTDGGPLFDAGPPEDSLLGHAPTLVSPLGLLRSGLALEARVPALFAALLPGGRRPTDHIEKLVWEQVDAARGELHPGLRVVAVERRSGRREVFTARPAERLPAAVAASCAVPAIFSPVRIAGQEYIDGGVHSCFNLDLAAEGRQAPVLVLSALSGPVPITYGPTWLGVRVLRIAVGRQLAEEVGRARRDGQVIDVIEPGSDEVLAMGRDLMSSDDIEFAYRVALARNRKRLTDPKWVRRLRAMEARPAA